MYVCIRVMSWLPGQGSGGLQNFIYIAQIEPKLYTHCWSRVKLHTHQDHEPDKKCANGSKERFLGGKHSAFLNRDRGHNRYSANGWCGLMRHIQVHCAPLFLRKKSS